MAGRKIFVGSLPQNIDDATLRAEFTKFGVVEDVFVKPNCPQGRQWAFITFQTPDQAGIAKDQCDRILHFPGSERPCDVMLAKNQGLYGQEPSGGHQSHGGSPGPQYAQEGGSAPRKIFVGSLPDGCQDSLLRNEFSRYGHIEEIYMKPNCESGRQWAFVTFQWPDQAQAAAAAADGLLFFPGAQKACEVTLARNQGLFGQGSMVGAAPKNNSYQDQSYQEQPGGGQRKIFVGSLPDDMSEHGLRAEFSKWGHITEVYLKTGCEPGRQWAFITFDSPHSAQAARDGCDRKLQFQGCSRPCEVTIARNQGLYGQDPVQGSPGPVGGGAIPALSGYPGQPPPPATPPPPHLTPWREYKTVSGLPYYHNHQTGQTVWECPPDLQPRGGGGGGKGGRYSPY